MKRMINSTKLIHSADRDKLLKNFLAVPEIKNLLDNYNRKPTEVISNQILQKLQTYYIYALLVSYMRKDLYFKSIHIKQKESARKQTLKYDDDSLDELPNDKNFDTTDLSWETLIDDPQLLKSLNTLSEYQSSILQFIYLQGYSQKQTADILHVSPQAIWKTHHAALERIRKSLKSKG